MRRFCTLMAVVHVVTMSVRLHWLKQAETTLEAVQQGTFSLVSLLIACFCLGMYLVFKAQEEREVEA